MKITKNHDYDSQPTTLKKTSKKDDDADEEYEDDGFTIMVRESICQPTHCNSKPAERRP